MRLIALALGCVALAGCGSSSVVRVVDGRAVAGRFISDRAYALYAIGADAEAHEDFPAARSAFEAASNADSESPEIWTRVGATRCRLDGDAEAAFSRAEDLDASYEPLWFERARCRLRAHHLDLALQAIEDAIRLDPDHDEDVTVEAAILEQMGRAADARRVLVALTVRAPRSRASWRALLDLSTRAHDAALARYATERLEALVPGGADERAPSTDVPAATLADLDDALRAADVATSRRLAKHLHLPGAELAVRAAALGASKIARDEAELVLDADPSDASARVALLVATDLGRDHDAFERALFFPIGSTPPSPLARALFAELLARHVGRVSAEAFLTARPTDVAPADALLEATRRRVLARIADPSHPAAAKLGAVSTHAGG